MPAFVRSAALACALLLAGCASLVDIPGIGSGAPVGGFRDDGSYELTEQERTLSCARLSEAERGLADDMKKHVAQAKAEREAAPKTVFNYLKRAFGGGGDGLAALDEYKRKSSMADAFAAEKTRRQCPADSNAAALAEVRASADAIQRAP
jgi:hypothetical protein